MIERRILRPNEEIMLGKQGENLARAITFDVSTWVAQYGEGECVLLNLRCGDDEPYLATITLDDEGIVRWPITSTDTAKAGDGKCELQYIVGEMVAKSTTRRTHVEESLTDPGETPDPQTSWIAQMLADVEEAVTVTVETTMQEYADAETARAEAETTREEAEEARAAAETARAKAEAARVTAEDARDEAETAREEAETARAKAETARVAAEDERAEAETARQDAEAKRVTAETARVSAEADRVTAEKARVSAETARAKAETERADAEAARAEAETARASAEAARATAESERAEAEAARVTAEAEREEAEAARQETIAACDEALEKAKLATGPFYVIDAVDNVTYVCNLQVTEEGLTFTYEET